jgi:phage gpG-like protein
MTPSQLSTRIRNNLNELTTFTQQDIPIIVGGEAVNYFRETFDEETSPKGTRWQDVQRRNPASKWYGHSGQTGRFSQSRTTAKILDGETGELRNAIAFRPEPGKVTVTNDKPYAAVHNFGLMAKIYGKKPFRMPKRTFMEVTNELMVRINMKIERELNRILQR